MSYDIRYAARASAQTLGFLTWVRETLGPRSETKAIAAVRAMEAKLARHPTRYRRFLLHPSLGDLRIATAYFHRFIYFVDEVE